jgi:hypothetical protein
VSPKAEYMRQYRRFGPQNPASRENSLPAEEIKERAARGESISRLAEEYGCDRRTLSAVLGKYPPCVTPGCSRHSRRTEPDLCRYCLAAQKKSELRR